MKTTKNAGLVVDDDPTVALCLQSILKDGFTLKHVFSIQDALDFLRHSDPEIIFLDINIGEFENGLARLAELRNKAKDTPVIVVSAKAFGVAIQSALKSGADDFLPKPFKKQEVLARVHSTLLKKNDLKSSKRITTCHDLRYDQKKRELSGAHISVFLSPKDGEFIAHLMNKYGKVVTRESILKTVWQDVAVSPNVLDQSVRRLRAALKDVQSPLKIVSFRNKGVQLTKAEEEQGST